jgi:phosphatidylinositol kinase/protein kinase (PI-3  family)
VESCAAYSLVCYILQLKDRHNGNILVDLEGHIIHIDFGFLLSLSPGNLGFESAPFKLTPEFVELMGGVNSDMFKYFKTLLHSGFLEVRRHADELVPLVEMMETHSRLPCFARSRGLSATSGLSSRLKLDVSDEACISFVDSLINHAMSSWTTQSYDSYQYYTNGISI